MSAFTVRIWWEWEFCRWSLRRANTQNRWDLQAKRLMTSLGFASVWTPSSQQAARSQWSQRQQTARRRPSRPKYVLIPRRKSSITRTAAFSSTCYAASLERANLLTAWQKASVFAGPALRIRFYLNPYTIFGWRLVPGVGVKVAGCT